MTCSRIQVLQRSLSRDASEDRAPSASQDASNKRPNRDQSFLQKIIVNTELNLSWIQQIEELEKDGVVITEGRVITSGPEKPTGASEEGRKDPRLIIPRYPSEYPGFPTDMSKFENARDFGQAVIMFWAKWRKEKKTINLHAKKEATRASKKAEKDRIDNQNKSVVGFGHGGGHSKGYDDRKRSDNRPSLDRRQSRDRFSSSVQKWPQRDGWARGRGRDRSNDQRHDRRDARHDRRDADDHHDKGQNQGSSGSSSSGSSSKAGHGGLDSWGFSKSKAANVSPDLILPSGKDIEVSILREKINQLPRDFLLDKQLIKDCPSASINEDGEMCIKENLEFWKDIIKDDFGLKTFNATKKVEQKQRQPLEPQHSLFQKQQQHKRDLMSRSAPLKSVGEGKPLTSEHSASVKRPLQQQQQK